ncbi:rhamnolipids biosynthesis 3-oxoacyl-reductase [Bombardia bombarda]|uniref:Rhamnolipids biosynthesis 3-oxoacyl-reductase n=1 Tax=Bombardia bombarda TaxID=252184 RepID=A0AA39X7S4_9PEZI|nr:rhamnolipids biosynthesis 3-oxoacyl-reductase [Bombardia bombarda]
MATTPAIDVDNLFNVKGLVALVTGGGTGIGLMMAKALADAGAARVYIVGRRVDVLQAAAASINRPAVVVPLYCDVTSKISLESIVSVIDTDVGFLNLLVCNAGIGGPQVPAPGPTTTLDEWRDQQLSFDFDDFTNTFKVNATSVWYSTMAFLKLLDKGNARKNVAQSSQVVVTSSIAGFNKRATGGSAYGASKAATTHIAKSLGVVLPRWNIRVNCICPGLFPSEMSAPIVQSMMGAAMGDGSEPIPIDTSLVPLGRMGDDVDMAGQILYLASRAGAYCNGNTIVIDGGRLGTMASTGY